MYMYNFKTFLYTVLQEVLQSLQLEILTLTFINEKFKEKHVKKSHLILKYYS